MAAAGTTPDSWKELCLIGIIPNGDTETAFAGMTEDITAMDWMEKDIEGMPLLNGGRVVKHNLSGEESITLKVYPTDALIDTTSVAQGVVQHFHQQATEDTAQPVVADNTLTRRFYGIILLWAETLPATAGALPAASKTAYRIQIKNAYMTAYKPSFDDKLLSAEITFKWAPFTKAAGANKREESTDGTVQLAAAMTTATAF